MALYGYLHAIGVVGTDPPPPPDITGIPEIFQKQKNDCDIQIYPNPTSGMLRVMVHPDDIRNKAYNLKIYNTTGQLQMLIRNTTPETVIDVSHLTTGVYLLRIENEEYAGSEKFTINR